MCLSLLSGQLAMEVCPHIQEALWLVALAVVGLLILAWPWAMTQEAVYSGHWEIKWHRRCEDRPEFWRKMDEWGEGISIH